MFIVDGIGKDAKIVKKSPIVWHTIFPISEAFDFFSYY